MERTDLGNRDTVICIRGIVTVNGNLQAEGEVRIPAPSGTIGICMGLSRHVGADGDIELRPVGIPGPGNKIIGIDPCLQDVEKGYCTGFIGGVNGNQGIMNVMWAVIAGKERIICPIRFRTIAAFIGSKVTVVKGPSGRTVLILKRER
jgi:hypothetical protein